MSQLSISAGDTNCRYLAAPESSTKFTQFGRHLDALGIKLPSGMPLGTLVQRGWIKPRLRVPIPIPALQSWTTFPERPTASNQTCPPEHLWGLDVWTAVTTSWRDCDRPVHKLWMHWLDDPDSSTAAQARVHAVDTGPDRPEPNAFLHSESGQSVLPWIDFFADWQAYHIAELVDMAQFTVSGVTDSFGSCAQHVEQHTTRFDERARALSQLWEGRGAFLDQLACYRTILANCTARDTFKRDTRLAAQSWAKAWGIGADEFRTGMCEVLLRLWQRWEDAAPVRSPRLMHRLQQDIQYGVRLLWNLSDEPIDPFASIWYWRHFSRGDWAQLMDALPYEEWLARRDFAKSAVHYQHGPPPFLLGQEQMTDALTQHWQTCPPLRRFCLAWVRLHGEMQGRDRDLPADLTIRANERIEQFNLIALHTERLLRHVASVLAPAATAKQDRSTRVVRDAALRSITHLAAPVLVPDQRIDDLIQQHTPLHSVTDLGQKLCTAAMVASGSDQADQLIAAHLNALIARNYAAHHDKFDEELIYPNREDAQPHPGSTLMSSCLLVVVAALHSLPLNRPATKA